MAALTFPRVWADELLLFEVSFTLKHKAEISPVWGGKFYAAEMGPSLWVAQIRSSNLEEEDFGIARAMFATLMNTKEIYMFDPLREYPFNYRNTTFEGMVVAGSSPSEDFLGDAFLTAVQSDNIRMSLGGLPNGFTLKPGDFLAFDYLDSRALHMVVVGGSETSSGNLPNIEVRPRIREGWTLSPETTVYLYRPSAKMIVIPDSYSESYNKDRVGQISCSLIQSL